MQVRALRPWSLSVVLVSTLACYQVTEQPNLAGQDLRLTVLHTSDIHSRLLPYEQTPGLIDRGLGLCAELQPLGGAARMAHLIKRERARSQRVMHLDSGDCFQGAPIFNAFKGEVEMRVMAQLRPDGVVIGNHEFDLGSRNIAEQYGRWGNNLFPLLAANYIWADRSDPNSHNLGDLVKPFEILNIEGLKVAVIGMGNTSSMTSVGLGGNSLGITPMESVESLRTWVDALHGSVDLIFVVSHMGLSARGQHNLAEDTEVVTGYERVVPRSAVQENWEIIGEEASGEVRVKVPGIVGIDAIFGGHLHIVLNPPKVLTDPAGRQVLLVHSGAFAKYLGRSDLIVRMPKAGEPAPYGAEIVSHNYTIFPITNRVPKKQRDAVITPDKNENGDCLPTFRTEEALDDFSFTNVCQSLFSAATEIRTCEEADRCRQLGDACSDACVTARRRCTSVLAPVDGAMQELLDPYVQPLYRDEALTKGFAIATRRIDRFGLSGEDSPLGNLVADAMRTRNRVEAQFALTNSLGIRTNMEQGVVTIEQMFNIFPFENSLTTIYLSGVEVQELFDYVTERSSERGCQTQVQVSGVTFTMNCAQAIRNENAPTCMVAEDCPEDFASAGTKNPVRCVEQRCFKSPAEDILIGGEAINPTESYKAAVNDFIARGGSGFDVLRRNTTKVDTSLSLRDALIDYMRKDPAEFGPGRICGSPFMVEPVPSPVRPTVVQLKANTPEASCDSPPSGCRDGVSGKLVRCDENETEVKFYCIPYDFRDPTVETRGDECAQVAEITPLFESVVRPADSEAGSACGARLDRECQGQLHCCERTLEDGSLQGDFYCVTPLCVDPPVTGRIRRVVQ